MKRWLGFLVLGTVFFAGAGLAQRVTTSSPFVLNLDYAKFRNDDKSAYVEVYYGFYPSLISYDLINGKYRGAVKLATRLRDRSSGEFILNERAVLPVTLADTGAAAMSSTFVSQAGYALPFGEYVLEVVAVDSLEGSRRDSITLSLTLKGYPETTASSDIELCSNIRPSKNSDDPFFKNSLEVMPNPTLVFGVASHPMMFNYLEFYNLDPEKTYTVRSEILGQDGKTVRESSRERRYGVRNAVEAGSTNVGSIPSGRYRFRLTLADSDGVPLTQSEKTFYIYNPHIQQAEVSPVALKASELAGLTAEELADEFARAQYVATDHEIKMFSQITSTEGRREFLAKFWADVEAGRLGRSGITRLAYLQRVSVANQRFRVLSREGWRTDRGRVLVLYAEPDEIERYPSSEQSKPYEIWHYYGIENGVQFVFIDRSGFGEYILVHSTKRGELRDDSWQRFLQ